MIRLNKYLSLCGLTSRRGADTLILEGRVTINNRKVEKPGAVIDETRDKVSVDGSPVVPVDRQVYIVLNKPSQTMTTLRDPFERKTVIDCLKGLTVRVYPVGRLDHDTEGVLLMTNDGELAYRLTHPKYGVKKLYEADVSGEFGPGDADRIRRGVRLDDGAIGKGEVQIIGFKRGVSRLRITLTEGRKREVKQLCKSVGHPVRVLKRLEFAGITDSGLKPGKWRYLTAAEVARLKKLVGLNKD